MNPVYKIVAMRSVQFGVPAAALWVAWQRFGNRPLKPRAADAALFTAGFAAYFASVFVGPFRLGYPRLLTRIQSALAAGAVALTFDDGPCPETTPRLLDALGEAGAKATFFVLLDQAARHPDLVRRIVREGHTLGLHGVSHEPMALWSARQIEQAVRMMLRELGPDIPAPRYLRPPHGFKSRSIQRAADRCGLTLVTWSLNPKDYQATTTEEIVARTIRRVRSGDIVLLHDARPLTADALPTLLRRLIGRGYRLVRL